MVGFEQIYGGMKQPKEPPIMAKEDNSNGNSNTQTTWTTWEELLLACAVNRHGFNKWDSVAMEVRAKTSLPLHLFTASNCQRKYRELKNRFDIKKQDQTLLNQQETEDDISKDDDKEKVVNIPWIEQLRQVRVAELRREVQRHDASILSLQSKVKRLEEDRERSLQANGIVEIKPDLDNDSKMERSDNDKIEPEKKTVKTLNSGEDSDRDNRSVNESNSTGSVKKYGLIRAVNIEPGSGRLSSVPISKMVGEESCSRDSGVSRSDEFDDCETQASGDLQSSSSLRRKRQRKERNKEKFGGGDGCGVGSASGGHGSKGGSVKSEPLVAFLEMIWAHRHSSLFERRLKSQESQDYKKLIRRHLDLETIQKKLELGLYSNCALSLFRDLLLLFNNAIAFFPKSAPESRYAHELRVLVSSEMKKETLKSDSSQGPTPTPIQVIVSKAKPELERSDSLLARQKSSVPLIVCRKRSSVAGKQSSSSLGQKADQQNSDAKKQTSDQKTQVEESVKEKEKPVTGARSYRRNNGKNPAKGNSNVNANAASNKKQSTNSGQKTGLPDKQDTQKTEKKKTEALPIDKKQSVADFLKRIKKNTPDETPKKNSKGGGGGETKKNSSSSGKKDVKERILRSTGDNKKVKVETTSPMKKNVGRLTKKGVEATASGKRGREGGGSAGGSSGKEKQQRKKARR